MISQRQNVIFSTAVFLAALALIVFGLINQGRYDYAQNVSVKLVIWTVYTLFELKSGLVLNSYIRFGVMAAILSDSLFGLYLNFYLTSSVFDKLQHVLGSYVFALFAYNLIFTISRPITGKGFIFVFVLALGLSIGAVYEVGEFIGDSFFNPQVPSQPSLLDTNLDLIADILGSLAAARHSLSLSED